MSADEDLEKILQDQGKGIFHSLIKNHLQQRPDHFYALQNAGNKFNKFIASPEFVAAAQNITIKMNQLTKVLSDPKIINSFQLFLELPAKRRKMVMEMSEYGWFPFEESLRRLPLKNETLDNYMENVIDSELHDLRVGIIELYPHRKHILDTAFSLYESKNYIACIPLFLSQIDGIPHDFKKVHFFTAKRGDYKFPGYLKSQMEGNKVFTENADLFLEIINKANDIYISGSTYNENETPDDLKILNRHGILHGIGGYLNYGTKINAQKTISLLCYVVFMISILE